MERQDVNNIELPIELLVLIFSFMRPKDVINSSRVSKKFLAAANENTLWLSFFRSDYNKLEASQEDTNYRKKYKDQIYNELKQILNNKTPVITLKKYALTNANHQYPYSNFGAYDTIPKFDAENSYTLLSFAFDQNSSLNIYVEFIFNGGICVLSMLDREGNLQFKYFENMKKLNEEDNNNTSQITVAIPHNTAAFFEHLENQMDQLGASNNKIKFQMKILMVDKETEILINNALSNLEQPKYEKRPETPDVSESGMCRII